MVFNLLLSGGWRGMAINVLQAFAIMNSHTVITITAIERDDFPLPTYRKF
jgi:hypothetical protein